MNKKCLNNSDHCCFRLDFAVVAFNAPVHALLTLTGLLFRKMCSVVVELNENVEVLVNTEM